MRTLVLLKPDCVKRKLVGRVISRIEDKGLRISGMRMLWMTPELSKRHYQDHVNEPWYPKCEAFMCSGRFIAMVIEGDEAISVMRAMAGQTDGTRAFFGTIRGDFTCSGRENIVHCSDSEMKAKSEISLFFPSGEYIFEEQTRCS